MFDDFGMLWLSFDPVCYVDLDDWSNGIFKAVNKMNIK